MLKRAKDIHCLFKTTALCFLKPSKNNSRKNLISCFPNTSTFQFPSSNAIAHQLMFQFVSEESRSKNCFVMLANDQLMYDEIYKFLKRIMCHAICYEKHKHFTHQLNIISKKNEPVLLFKTNNVGIETFPVCCGYGQLIGMELDLNLKKSGHPTSFNSLPPKLPKQLFWLVLPGEICLVYLHNSEQEHFVGG